MQKEKLRVQKEIGRLNIIIDNKIIMGKPYKAEAQKHKDLRAYLKDLK